MGEHMPMWCPPTPPQDDNDVYIDQTVCFMYEPSVMPESQLPAIFVKKELKRSVRVEGRKLKVRKEEPHHRVPRSLFDRPSALMRRDAKLVRIRQGMMKPYKPQTMMTRPLVDSQADHPEWLIHEDWALLQAVQMLLELPLSLATNSPAHIVNWDLVADVVNAQSRTYRSAKQCKNRYEVVIVPREEGKILYDVNPRKQKKSKGIYKLFQTKNNRPMRTSQLFGQDNNGSVTTLYSLRYDSCKSIATKRRPTLRPTLANPQQKNPKHAAVLAESGINYELPLTPIQVAQIRQDRIAKEKKQNQAQAAEQQLAAQKAQQQQQQQQQQQPQQQQQIAVATAAATVAGGQQMAIVQGQPLQPVVTASGTTTVLQTGTLQKATAVTAVSLARTLGATGSIVVNTAGGVAGNTFATINKRMNQTVAGVTTPQSTAVKTTLPTVTTTQLARRPQAAVATPRLKVVETVSGALTQAVRARSTTAPMTVQEITAAVVSQAGARVATHLGSSGAQVITTTTLTPAQLIAAQRAGTVTATQVAAGTVQQQVAQKHTFTPQQLQFLKQQALRNQTQQQQLKQQQRLTPVQADQQLLRQQQLKQRLQVQALQQQAGTVQKTVAMSTPLFTSVAQAQVSQGATTRLQAPKAATVKQAEAAAAALLKRQQLQQKVATLGAAVQGATQVHQVQVTQAQVIAKQLTAAQLIASTQLQQVPSQSGATSQPVATLVKTVSSQGGSAVPSVTIPVSAVSAVNLGNVNISVSMPQQKSAAGKTVMQQQQIRQIHLPHTLQQRKTTAAQLQQAQKVATLTAGQVRGPLPAQVSAALQIIQQPQQKIPGVLPQQFQQLIKTPPGQIQQIITSVAPSQTTTATVIGTQIVSQSPHTIQTVSKVSLPSSTVLTTAVPQHTRTAIPMTVSAVPSSGMVTAVVSPSVASNLASQHGMTITTSSMTLNPNQTLVKQIGVGEVVVNPAKALPLQGSVAQQLKQVRQVPPGTTVQVAQIPQQVVKQTPSIAVQQALQQVQAQAQQQAQQRHQVVAVSGPVPPSTVAVSLAPGASSPNIQVQQVVQQQIAGGQQPVTTGAPTTTTHDQQPKPSPYTMRLRNPPKHS